VPNPNGIKGARAELEVQRLFRDQLGIVTARRALGAGRKDDIGDITGIGDLVVQVANWGNVAAAVRQKPIECEQQRLNAGATHAATFVRLRGGTYRVVQTEAQFFTMYNEVIS
jgi:hypothetical protein